jgi:hypothetical protein
MYEPNYVLFCLFVCLFVSSCICLVFLRQWDCQCWSPGSNPKMMPQLSWVLTAQQPVWRDGGLFVSFVFRFMLYEIVEYGIC